MKRALEYVVNCDWGLILLYTWITGDTVPLLRQQAAVEARGLKYAVRLYIDAAHGVNAPAQFFWRGHEWLDRIAPRFLDKEHPSVAQLLDVAKANGIEVVAVMSDFHPGWPPEYNEVRHHVGQGDINRLWDLVLAKWGTIIVACQVDNEPFSGGAAYDSSDYRERAQRESHYIWQRGYEHVITTRWSYGGTLSDAHLPIGRAGHAWPPLTGIDVLAENWLLPDVPGSQYAELIRRYRADKWMIGVNFGAPFIPMNGLRWGNKRFNSTFLCTVRAEWTATGILVLQALGDVVVEEETQPAWTVETLLARLASRNRARVAADDRLRKRLNASGTLNPARLRGRRQEINDEVFFLMGILGGDRE